MAFQSDCFIIDPSSGETFVFQLDPVNIAQRKNTNIKTTPIPGASQPRVVASSGGIHTIDFKVFFFAEDDDNHNPEWVQRQVDWLASLNYARTTNRSRGTRRVIPVYLSMGVLIEMPVQLRSFSVSWGPFVDTSLRPLRAQVSLTFVQKPLAGDFTDALQARAGQYNHKNFVVTDNSQGGNAFLFSGGAS